MLDGRAPQKRSLRVVAASIWHRCIRLLRVATLKRPKALAPSLLYILADRMFAQVIVRELLPALLWTLIAALGQKYSSMLAYRNIPAEFGEGFCAAGFETQSVQRMSL